MNCLKDCAKCSEVAICPALPDIILFHARQALACKETCEEWKRHRAYEDDCQLDTFQRQWLTDGHCRQCPHQEGHLINCHLFAPDRQGAANQYTRALSTAEF